MEMTQIGQAARRLLSSALMAAGVSAVAVGPTNAAQFQMGDLTVTTNAPYVHVDHYYETLMFIMTLPLDGSANYEWTVSKPITSSSKSYYVSAFTDNVFNSLFEIKGLRNETVTIGKLASSEQHYYYFDRIGWEESLDGATVHISNQVGSDSQGTLRLYFAVNQVPEPSGYALAGVVAALALGTTRAHRRRQAMAGT